jgi:hypothetical protein
MTLLLSMKLWKSFYFSLIFAANSPRLASTYNFPLLVRLPESGGSYPNSDPSSSASLIFDRLFLRGVSM